MSKITVHTIEKPSDAIELIQQARAEAIEQKRRLYTSELHATVRVILARLVEVIKKQPNDSRFMVHYETPIDNGFRKDIKSTLASRGFKVSVSGNQFTFAITLPKTEKE